VLVEHSFHDPVHRQWISVAVVCSMAVLADGENIERAVFHVYLHTEGVAHE
jgi:hypothetical protein